MSTEKKVTMQEIANKVGVSKYAVSKALSGKQGISAATREQIFAVASQWGYINKRALKKKQNKDITQTENRMVGILIPDMRSQNKESGYWGKILDGIFANLDSRGIGWVIITDDSPRNFNSVIKSEGLLGIICVGLTSSLMLLELKNLFIPYVTVDHEEETLASDSIFMNNFDSLRKLTYYLLGLGHTHIQFIGDIHYSRSFFDRWSGFKSMMEEKEMPYERNLKLLEIIPSLNEAQYNKLLLELTNLSAGKFPTAFVCANDQIAIVVLRALSEMGIRVPEDCALTGFDNNNDILKQYDQITTVNAEKEALGIRAVDILFWRLENSHMPFQKTLLNSDIIIRKSTSIPK